MDNVSKYGYNWFSPYRSNPYLDITTPKGIITMENTPHDILGIDNRGNVQHMKAWDKSPYKFDGNVVREIPIKDQKKMQMGGSPYAKILSFIFEEDEDEVESYNPKQEMSTENQVQQPQPDLQQEETESPYVSRRERFSKMYENLNRNPYKTNEPTTPSKSSGYSKGVNPYLIKTSDEILSEFSATNLGVWGDKSHQKRKSDHNTGDAQDFGFDSPETANKIVSKLQSEADKRKIKYIIYNGRIWNPSISNDWRPYSGSNPHNTHIHVSYNR